MATTSPVIVFQTLDQPHSPPTPVLEELKKQGGFVRAFFGVKMEDPQAGVLCTGASSFPVLVSKSPEKEISCLCTHQYLTNGPASRWRLPDDRVVLARRRSPRRSQGQGWRQG
jgi:hypothetical protein